MKRLTVTRRFKFDAAHRLRDYDGPCSNIHGHSYVVEVEVEAVRALGCLDELGMVIDFSQLKKTVGKWIDDNWDHALLLDREDAVIIDTGLKIFWFDGNPTAENMAKRLVTVCTKELPDGVTVRRVRVQETENCYAEIIV